MGIGSLNETVEDRVSSLWRLTTVALVLVCLGYAALLLNIQSWDNGGATILWPSNGLLLGVLLCSRRRQWAAYLAVGFAVDLGLNLSLSFAPGISIYLAGCNMLEVGIGAALTYRTISPNPDLTQRRQLVRLLAYGVVLAPAIASALAQLSISHLHAVPRFTAAKHWFVADALGIAVMTPLYLSFRGEGAVSRPVAIGGYWTAYAAGGCRGRCLLADAVSSSVPAVACSAAAWRSPAIGWICAWAVDRVDCWGISDDTGTWSDRTGACGFADDWRSAAGSSLWRFRCWCFMSLRW